MVRFLVFRFRRRRANSTLIGGLIVLSLLLSALAMSVFVSQQSAQYQQTVGRVALYRNQQELLEDLVVNSPGMFYTASWSGCGGCNLYNMSVSNVGQVGTQIVRIYINSTASGGCSSPNPQPCIINPASSAIPYGFSEAQAFINAGLLNQPVLLYLPSTVTLPNPCIGNAIVQCSPENTVTLVTARGNLFTFQWPFQPPPVGPAQEAFSSGNMKIAYTGSTYDSENEPGVTSLSGGSTPSNDGYCHQEAPASYPAAAGYAEELTGISGVTDTDKAGHTGALWFLNPWMTAYPSSGNYKAVFNSAAQGSSTTQVYIYVVVVNDVGEAYTPTAGTIDMTWYGSNHIDGYLIGIYYGGQFYATSSPQNVQPGQSYYAIFKITIFTIGNWPSRSVMFWGGASLTDAPGGTAEGGSYFAGTILLSGLWVRMEQTSGSCTWLGS